MTHEELYAEAVQGRALYWQLRNGLRSALDENRAISAKLEAQEKHFCIRCHHQWRGGTNVSYCGDCHRECQALKAQLEALQAENERQSECERALIGAVHSWSQRAEAAEDRVARLEASRGEVVTPQLECIGPFSDARDCPVHRGDVVKTPQPEPKEVITPQAITALKEAIQTAHNYYMLFHDAEWGERIARWESALTETKPEPQEVVTPPDYADEATARRRLKDWQDNVKSYQSEPQEVVTACPQWQPIETAPKDGTRIDVYRRECTRIQDVFWDVKWKVWSDGHGRIVYDPTHWMPPPNPPTTSV